MKLDADVIIVGGGMAGLQAAIQLGRYLHRTVVIDGGEARSRWCRKYSNLLGWPQGVSGEALRSAGRRQAEQLGVRFIDDVAISAEKQEGKFCVRMQNRSEMISSSVMLLSTGVLDRLPSIPGLEQCLGMSVYVCTDCDGYEALNRRTVVMGTGDIGARLALAVTYWSDRIVYVNDGSDDSPSIDRELFMKLKEKAVEIRNDRIEAVETKRDGMITAVRLHTGDIIEAERGFIAYGGNQVRTDLAGQLGAERMDTGHLVTDPRTKMTTVDGLWAAGDIGVHSQMVTVAIAEGSLSAVWMHKALLGMGVERSHNRLIPVQG